LLKFDFGLNEFVVRHLFMQFFQFAYFHETFVLAIPKPVPLYFFLLGHRPPYVNLPSFHIDNDVVWMRDRIPADNAERRSSFKLVFPLPPR
jgi:hypothetical protein